MRWIRSSLPLFTALIASGASASPWTLPADDVAVVVSFDFGTASQEFFDTSRAQAFPLRGQYSSATFTLGGRFGLTDRLELEASLPIRLVAYSADPVIIVQAPGADAAANYDFYQDNVIDLSQTNQGLGDLRLAGRYRFLLRPFALAAEVSVKAPTGYDRPEGTFGDRPATSEAFLADVGRFVRPENVRDDVTLGDGQLDLGGRILFGYALPTRTFVRADLGYLLRTAGAADQVVGALKVGQFIDPGLLVYANAEGFKSVQSGKVIGVSVGAVDPEVPARDYGGLDNLVLIERRLEQDYVQVGGGLIVRLAPRVELNLGYSRIVWGHNVAVVSTFSASLAMATSL